MKYPVIINQSDYGYDAHCPVVPGCHSQGDTFEEACDNIRDAIAVYLRMIEEETKTSHVYLVEVDTQICNAVH